MSEHRTIPNGSIRDAKRLRFTSLYKTVNKPAVKYIHKGGTFNVGKNLAKRNVEKFGDFICDPIKVTLGLKD